MRAGSYVTSLPPSFATTLDRRSMAVRSETRKVWLVVLSLVVVACAPSSVTLDRLVADQDDLAGRRVTVAGTVVPFEEPDGSVSFVLEDDRKNRVLLIPTVRVEDHAGKQVVVTGEFDFDPEVGRLLRIEEVRPTEG